MSTTAEIMEMLKDAVDAGRNWKQDLKVMQRQGNCTAEEFQYIMENFDYTPETSQIAPKKGLNKLFAITKMSKKGRENLAPRKYLLKRLEIEEGTLALLCAAGNSGKTMLVQHLAMSVNSGTPFLGNYPVARGQVLHIDMENNIKQIERRYERLANGLDINEFDITKVSLDGGRLDSPENIKTIEQDLVELCSGYTFVVIDSLKAVSEADENSAQIEIICKVFKRVADKANCAILLVHHKGKGKGESRQSGRGHSSIYDSVDVQIDINHEGDSSTYTLECAKNRDGAYFKNISYRLEDSGEFWPEQNCSAGLRLVAEAETEISQEKKKDSLDVTILKSLSEKCEVSKSVNQSELYSVIGGERAKFNKTIDELLAKKLISEAKGAKNARIFSITDQGKSFINWSE